MSIFQGVIEYNSMEYYFNGERILCEYIGDYFIDYSIYVIIVLI